MIRGIDISHFENSINLAVIPGDIAFVSMKASQGVSYQDPFFQTAYHELKNNRPEIVRIPYHFFDWQAGAAAQVQNILSRGVDYTGTGTGPLMLDLEADSGSIIERYIVNNRAVCIQRVDEFINLLTSDARYKRDDIIIYSNDDFIKNVICHTWPHAIFWVASYQHNPPPVLPGWPYKAWQYSEFGQLNGAVTGGHLDLDQWMGSQEELNAIANINPNT